MRILLPLRQQRRHWPPQAVLWTATLCFLLQSARSLQPVALQLHARTSSSLRSAPNAWRCAGRYYSASSSGVDRASSHKPLTVVPLRPLPSPPTTQLWSDATVSFSSDSEDLSKAATTKNPAEDSDDGTKLFEGFGVGILRDYKARLPYYKTDFADGLNLQCLAASLFLFFACLAPAVGFGGLFAAATKGSIGVVEMVTSTAVCGVLYALLSAQPLTIIGSTGPVLAFVACLAPLADALHLPFLPLYAWTGLWTSANLFGLAVTSGSNLVRYLTRFTDEIFSTLISTIFVVEAVSDVARTFASPASDFTKALLTLVCATLTYSVSTMLRRVRQGSLFNRVTRTTLSNFAPTLGVVSASLVARWARIAQGTAIAGMCWQHRIRTPSLSLGLFSHSLLPSSFSFCSCQTGLPALSIPDVFGTTSGRPWLVPLGDLPIWARWASFLPALMATVLLFLDQNITVRLVNNPRWNMIKGRRRSNVLDGMHADLLVVALLTAGQSLLGIPWLVAATVRSLSHIGALGKFDDATGKRIGTVEQRLTGVTIHTLIGCCVAFRAPRDLLKQVPLAVLMGLFLYLGTSSLPGNEMWERMVGFFRDPNLAPPQRWDGIVPRSTVHIFTALQVALLGAMFWVKESPLGVLFPVVIAALAPVRFGLERAGFINKEYMAVLDEE